MKIGISPFGVQAMKYPLIAKKAEEVGFESFWMPEHLIMPTEVPNKYPYTPGFVPPITAKTQLYDPWVTLAWLAAATEKINLATGVFILPLRHPIYTARQVATLDMLSRGRVLMGVGVGWQPEEFDYVDLGWKDRGPRMGECIEVMRKLWTQPVIEHHGEFFDLGPCTFEPKPTRPGGPPIIIAGNSEIAMRRTGQYGDGWIGHSPTFAQNKEMVAKINMYRSEFGRDKAPFEFTSGLKKDTPGPASLDEVKSLEEIGIDRLQVTPWMPVEGKLTVDHMLEGIENYGNSVVAKTA